MTNYQHICPISLPDKSEITIHQLLTHTSGLKNDYWDQHSTLTEAEYIAKILNEPLEAPPGSHFSYANFGYHLLAKTIEVLTQKSYERFLVEELFLPNGMAHTGFNLAKWQKNQIVEYTDWTTESSAKILKNPLDRPIYLQPEGSGGILSTTQDLYQWFQTVFHSDKVLSEGSRKRLLTPDQQHYAYGWEVYQTSRGTSLIEHGGYDSWVGVVTGLYYFAEEDIVVIFLGNTHLSQMLRKEALMDQIEAFLFGGQVTMPPSQVFSDSPVEDGKFLGNYAHSAGSISISKGRSGQQIRLRTSDEAVIQKLLLPGRKESENSTDVQLEYVLDHLARKEYEPLRNMLFQHPSFEALVGRYSKVLDQLTAALGSYQGLQVLQVTPATYEGNFELQMQTKLSFENGPFYVRVFRNHQGRMHIQPLELPEKLELFLAQAGKDEYIYWNFRTGMSSTLKIDAQGLTVDGEVFSKK